MHYYTHEELDGATRASLNGFARTIKLRGRSKLKVNELRDALRERLPPREGTSPGLFVELCAGTAALSLRLHKEQAKPPQGAGKAPGQPYGIQNGIRQYDPT
jgi:hypothetical protein